MSDAVIVAYTNYRGETACRVIRPLRLYWGANEWHPEPQWLLDVIDMDRGVERTFAMGGITEWRSKGGAS